MISTIYQNIVKL